ncbi:glucose dehydrogenase [FAD, quinone]-like [Agrilus planipennis]|uniref:Glucose dehydrogenase [FAD, quinone]-like n=1 Tax=Agrilus planipennis TaxID=224129 RepID=A0A7F5RIU0_AGRPL|nr:glucose dehydrogenase [FAD, quinone]-like [Agrilus planipennis]
MICKHFLSIIFFLTLTSADIEDDLDYYEQLIKENIEESRSHQTPTSFQEFQLTDKNAVPTRFGRYDFIIVGGGTAGSLLARRLSEVKLWNVLVIEGGAHGDKFTEIPAMSNYTLTSDYNWGFTTTPQKTSCLVPGIPDQRMRVPRGKALGGTTVINGNAFSRGFPSDYDRWGAKGLPSWTYENVLPYFKKFENASSLRGIDTEYHGFDGPLVVENTRNTSELSEIFIRSIKSFGYNLVDYNGRDPIGVGYMQTSTRNGRRNSGDSAFLSPVERRTNLKLQINSLVTKLLIKGNTVRGVEFISGNKKYRAYARIEVILSAGSFQSPQILMLSGIGPKSELSKHNISVKLDLPVGLNLRDQHQTTIIGWTNISVPVTPREAIAQYLRTVGPLTITQGMQLATFCNTSYSPVELVTIVYNRLGMINGSLSYVITRATAFAHLLMFLHPKSVGSVQLASDDPLQHPIINPNYLQYEEEVETIVEGAQFLMKILENEEFRKYNLTMTRDPNCRNFTFNSKDYWRCVARCSGEPGNHPSGTCIMGVSPKDSVVNERLLVHGMKNLRVVDASVIPVNLNGHMYATAYMIAEKAADFIKQDYGIIDSKT